MYDFICLQYAMGRITREKVLSYAPRWITEEQARNMIGGKV